MSNYYKKMLKISFRGNVPRMNDLDRAFSDPYKSKGFYSSDGLSLNIPADQSTTGFGADYYNKKQPPAGTSVIDEKATRPHWRSDTDGEDASKNDVKPEMTDPFALYDSDSPIGMHQVTMRRLNSEDRDTTAVGPHNMSSKSREYFDKIRSRVN